MTNTCTLCGMPAPRGQHQYIGECLQHMRLRIERMAAQEDGLRADIAALQQQVIDGNERADLLLRQVRNLNAAMHGYRERALSAETGNALRAESEMTETGYTYAELDAALQAESIDTITRAALRAGVPPLDDDGDLLPNGEAGDLPDLDEWIAEHPYPAIKPGDQVIR